MLKQKLLLLLLISTVALWAQRALSSGKPCSGHHMSMADMRDCSAFRYKEADAHLNKVYQKAMRYMTDDLARAQEEADQQLIRWAQAEMSGLEQAELAWLSYRDLQCKAAGHRNEGGSMQPLTETGGLTTLTEHRIAEIKSLYEDGDRKLE